MGGFIEKVLCTKKGDYMKRFFSVIAVFVAVLWLVGCGDKENGVTGDIDLTGTITISPTTAFTGEELTANYSGSEKVNYQWNKDGTAIGGKTVQTYTPTEAGSYTVTISLTGYRSKTSGAVVVSVGDPELTGDITITPNTDVLVNTELTATYSGSETVSYQWEKDGNAIDGETDQTYTPSEAGSYTVTVSLTGYRSKTSTAVEVAVTIQRTLTYNGNGNTGGEVPTDNDSPYQNGATAIVLGNTRSLAKTGESFTGWNTAADGSGIPYIARDTFIISENTILYAQWTTVTRTVIYNGNGNTGGEVPTDSNSPYQSGATVTVLGNTGNLVKTDTIFSSFAGWNTAANGSGTSYTAGDTFTMSNTNITLYAHWVWENPTATPSPTATLLPVNTWVEGSIAEETEQWYTITATAIKHYIHLNFTGTRYAFVQLFNNLGIAVGSDQMLNASNSYAEVSSLSRELEIGKSYYVRVRQAGDGSAYKGVYRIAFTETNESPNMITLPYSSIVSLTVNTWADGEINSANRDQWYSFSANATSQYVHILKGTLYAFVLQVYGSNGGTVGESYQSFPSGTVGYVALAPLEYELENNETYYIRVIYIYYTGTFKIAFNGSTNLPPTPAVTLVADTWADGTTIDGGKWYTLTANANTQYIHFNFTAATGANVNLFDSNRNMLGTHNTAPIYLPYFSRELSSGSVYYLYVTSGTYDGAFQIAFNTTETPPAITLPSDNVTELTANAWTSGSIAYNGKQWFKFTANESPQYVHISGISTGLTLRLYDSSGNGIGNPLSIMNNTSNPFLVQTVTSGQVYYVKVEGRGYTENNYRISFNGSRTPPALE
jgi:hypothetical protein